MNSKQTALMRDEWETCLQAMAECFSSQFWARKSECFQNLTAEAVGRCEAWVVCLRHHLGPWQLRLCSTLPTECLGNRFPLSQSETLGILDRQSQLRIGGEASGLARGRMKGQPHASLAIKASIVLKELTCIPGLQLARNNGV